MPTESQKQILDRLVSDRRLSTDEARRILRAPRVTLPLRWVATAVATVLLSVGLIRFVVALVDEAPETLIVVLLYALFLVGALVAWRWHRRSGWRRVVGEFSELVGLGSAIGATAILMVDADLDGHWLAISFGAAAATWGIVRLRTSLYAGAVALVPGAIALAGGVTAWMRLEEGWSTIPFLVAGGVLVVLGQADVALAGLVRLAGVAMVVVTSPAWLSFREDLTGLVPALVVGAVLIGTGTAWSRVEQVVGGSIVVVVGVTSYSFRHIDNEILQGVVVAAIGALGLATVFWTLRRHRRNEGETPSEQA